MSCTKGWKTSKRFIRIKSRNFHVSSSQSFHLFAIQFETCRKLVSVSTNIKIRKSNFTKEHNRIKLKVCKARRAKGENSTEAVAINRDTAHCKAHPLCRIQLILNSPLKRDENYVGCEIVLCFSSSPIYVKISAIPQMMKLESFLCRKGSSKWNYELRNCLSTSDDGKCFENAFHVLWLKKCFVPSPAPEIVFNKRNATDAKKNK